MRDPVRRFTCRLALAFGRVDVEAFEEEVELRSALTWAAFFEVEPFGDIAEDARFAQLCCLVANALRGESSGPIPVERFMLTKESRRANGADRPPPEAIAKALFGWANDRVDRQERSKPLSQRSGH